MNLSSAFILIICVLTIAHGFPNIIKNASKSKNDTQDKLTIYNGKDTTIEAHPYLVSILQNNEFQCTGTILSDNWCITVRDCLEGFSAADNWTVVAASLDGFTGHSYSASDVVFHPQQGVDLSYEYGLLQIVGMFQWSAKVRPIKLPTSEIADYTLGMVAGYSFSEDDVSIGPLQQGGMRWFPNNICNETFTNLGYTWTDRTGCLYSYNRTTLCTFDQGTPFTHKGALYGVFIAPFPTGTACTDYAGPVAVADIFPVASWIQSITGASYNESSL